MEIKELSVLIVDDAPVVLATVRSMLLKMGYVDGKIHTVKSAREALISLNENKFDVVICDYNLGFGMNGKQLFEQVQLHKLLPMAAVFVLVTGENAASSVMSILELRPDEYLLKPFNKVQLQERLNKALKRKLALSPLYQALSDGDSPRIIELCDELAPFYTSYSTLLSRLKGEALLEVGQFQQAKSVFEERLTLANHDWAVSGLASSIFFLEGAEAAKPIIAEKLAEMPKSSLLLDEAAKYALLLGDKISALHHLMLANRVSTLNIQREICLINLSRLDGNHNEAFNVFGQLINALRGSMRCSTADRLQYTRLALYCLSNRTVDTHKLASIESEYEKLLRTINDSVESEIQIINAHIAFLRFELRRAKYHLSHVKQDELSFEGQLEYLWLLHNLHMCSEYVLAKQVIEDHLRTQKVSLVSITQNELVGALNLAQTKQQEWVNGILAKAAGKSNKDKLEGYLDIVTQLPYVKEPALKVIQLLAIIWPTGYGSSQVLKAVKLCARICRESYSNEELIALELDSLIRKIKLDCQTNP